MSEQQYRVIADKKKGDDPYAEMREPGDRVTYGNPAHIIVRIERPVPTEHCLGTHYHDSHLWTGKPGTHYWCKGYAAPDEILPTREQIAEVVLDGFHAPDGDHPSWWINPLATADAVLALLQKGADREWPAADDGSDLTWRERNGADRG